MDTLPVQIAAAPPAAINPAAAAAATNPADDNVAADGSGAPALPHRFGALLALQLGGIALKGGKPAAVEEPLTDEKTAADPAAAATLAADPLAGINLPGLLPPTTPVVTPAVAKAVPAAAQTGPARGAEPAALNAAATPGAERAPAEAPAAAHPAFAAVTAAADNASGTREAVTRLAAQLSNGEPAPHAAETGSVGNLPPALPQINTAPAPVVDAPVRAALEARVGTPDWNTELGQNIVWMVGDKQQVAELSINPPDLGPLDIKLTIDGSQTTAVFTSPHSAVREAVESALPRLREVLAESGIMLGNASVTADTPRDSQAFAERQQADGSSRGNGDKGGSAEPPPAAPRPLRAARGLVDLFA